MAISATYSVSESSSSFGQYRSQVLAGIDAALAALSGAVAGNAKLQISVNAISESSSMLASAGPRNLVYIGSSGGSYQYEPSLAYQLRTGIDKNGSQTDVIINVNTQKLERFFFDSSPWDASDIPEGKNDFISTMIHEIFHGIGFVGTRDDYTGKYLDRSASVFDQHITFVGGRPYFTGDNVNIYYGGSIPLTVNDIYHVGNETGAGSDLANSLMSPYANTGVRDYITAIEKAMLADLGIGTNQADILRVHPEPSSQSLTLRAGYGTDTAVYTGQRGDYTVTYSAASGGYTVKGYGYTDTLLSVEKVKIGNTTYWIEDLAGMNKGVHRFYNTETGTHFFTGSNAETYSVRQNNIRMEDEGFAFANATGSNSLEVFRFQNKQTGAYFYTINTTERDNIQKTLPTFEYQGSSFRAYTTDNGPQEELYRFYNTATGSHFFTTAEAERDNIMANIPTFKYEGIGFYVDILS